MNNDKVKEQRKRKKRSRGLTPKNKPHRTGTAHIKKSSWLSPNRDQDNELFPVPHKKLQLTATKKLIMNNKEQ
jgi:hypothetical protein